MASENQQPGPEPFVFAKGSDVGRVRDHNEDYVDAFSPPDPVQRRQKGVLFIVADGMGGHQAGDVASRTAVEMVSHEYYADADAEIRGSLVRAIKKANSFIYEEAQRVASRAGMGTTIVAAVVRGRELLLANVGDSRAYMLRQGKVAQATRDHSFVADQVRAGLLTIDEARVHPQRNVITRALGSRPEVQVDTYNGEFQPGDSLLLCSDGLSEYVHEEDMLAVMPGSSAADAVKRLVAMARERGGSDNISALIVQADTPAGVATTMPVMRAASAAPTESQKRRQFPWLAAGVAAAGLVGIVILATVFVILPRLRSGASPAPTGVPATAEGVTVEATEVATEASMPTEAATEEAAGLGFTLDSPADGATVPAGLVEFRWGWGGPAPDAVVEFVVNSDQGELCRAEPDTGTCEGAVQEGVEYIWWVEYKAGGFNVDESDHRRLTVGPQAAETPTITVTVTLSSTTSANDASATEAADEGNATTDTPPAGTPGAE